MTETFFEPVALLVNISWRFRTKKVVNSEEFKCDICSEILL